MAPVLRKPIARPALQPSAKAPPPKTPPRILGKPGAKPALAKPAMKPVANRAPGGSTDGFAVARDINKEKQRQAEIRKNQPMEFRMKVGESSNPRDETAGVQVILLDVVRHPNPPFFHYMHRWGFKEGVKGSMKSDICIQDDPQGCPLCKKLGQVGSYEMVLTCLDGRKFTPQNGPNAGKVVPVSKKLFIVKTGMIPIYERLYKQHKTFRGMVIQLHRDNAKSPSSGSSVNFVKMLSENDLRKHYPQLLEQVDYSKAYPRPTYDELAARHGEASSNDSSVGGSDFGGDDDGDAVPF